jgi:hypothetical protein
MFTRTNLGDTPHVYHGAQEELWALFYGNTQENALFVPITLSAGYGKLPAGQIIAKNLSAAGRTGQYVPYNPTTFTGGEEQAGKAFLVANSGTGGSDLYVTMDDSYKFAVGDDLIVNSDGETAENLGAITAIDRTSETHRAKITVTETVSDDHTTANSGYVAVEAGISANNYSDAVGILVGTIDTGTGEDAKGGQGQLLVSNAIIYTGALKNYDAAAGVDLGSPTEYGDKMVIK